MIVEIEKNKGDFKMLVTFTDFDGSTTTLQDGGLGLKWAKKWALDNLYILDIYQVSAPNFICPGYEFFSN